MGSDTELLKAMVGLAELDLEADMHMVISVMLCAKWWCAERDIDLREIGYEELTETFLEGLEG